jgi:2-(1,2-epoxy-1,2-dihydrophenyl)acetyl-CoA isomerase
MANMNDSLSLRTEGRVAILTFMRPKQLNALNETMVDALDEAARTIAADDQVRCVVLKGEGDHFMAGGDLGFFNGLLNESREKAQERIGHLIERAHSAILSFHRMEKPIIASVQGAAAGIGFSFASGCDLVIAADDSYFTLAYCQIGTSPDGGSTWFLPRLLGPKRTMGFALLGNKIDAQTALSLGLVNQVVPRAALEEEALKVAERLASGANKAYAKAKALINSSFDNSLEDHLLAEKEAFIHSVATEDFREGISSFVEKRPPTFKGC